jgi:hypothetical protein
VIFGRVAIRFLVYAVVGAACGLTLGAIWPREYMSVATFAIVGRYACADEDPTPAGLTRHFEALTVLLRSTKVLGEIAERQSLYPSDNNLSRAERLKREVQVSQPLQEMKLKRLWFAIRFAHPNRLTAQTTLRDVVSRLVEEHIKMSRWKTVADLKVNGDADSLNTKGLFQDLRTISISAL